LSSAASTAGTAAVNLANQAHAQAAKVAPTIIPAPAGTADSGVDTSHDLSPTDKVGVKKLENFLHDRPTAADLQQHNILKGEAKSWDDAKRSFFSFRLNHPYQIGVT
jgi:hypothetical protein